MGCLCFTYLLHMFHLCVGNVSPLVCLFWRAAQGALPVTSPIFYLFFPRAKGAAAYFPPIFNLFSTSWGLALAWSPGLPDCGLTWPIGQAAATDGRRWLPLALELIIELLAVGHAPDHLMASAELPDSQRMSASDQYNMYVRQIGQTNLQKMSSTIYKMVNRCSRLRFWPMFYLF